MNSEMSSEEITECALIDKNTLLKLALDVGEEMLICGGEVSRVEDTINRICVSYGAIKSDVFSITTAIVATVEFDEKNIVTQSRRVVTGARDFNKLEELNNLSRNICKNHPTVEYIENEISRIKKIKNNPTIIAFIGGMIASGGFAVFFGGSLFDGLAAMIASIGISIIDKYVYNNRVNKVVYYMVSAFAAGVIAQLLIRWHIGQNLDKIMIGCIMLVIPGINFTSAVEDVLSGDTATGSLKFFESMLIACAIAGGFGFSVYLCGGIL